MLVLSRKEGETVLVGAEVTVRVLEIRGKRVRLGFEGPAHVPFLREELERWVPTETDEALIEDAMEAGETL